MEMDRMVRSVKIWIGMKRCLCSVRNVRQDWVNHLSNADSQIYPRSPTRPERCDAACLSAPGEGKC